MYSKINITLRTFEISCDSPFKREPEQPAAFRLTGRPSLEAAMAGAADKMEQQFNYLLFTLIGKFKHFSHQIPYVDPDPDPVPDPWF
jgi:hypothetical protein